MNITQDRLSYIEDQINKAFMENREVMETNIYIDQICQDGDMLSCKIGDNQVSYSWIQSDHCTLYLLSEFLYSNPERYGIVNCIVCGSTQSPFLNVRYRKVEND